jgi:hypothetical protein
MFELRNNATNNLRFNQTFLAAYRIDLIGDINMTWEFRKNTSLYKPAGAVLADTTTALATSRNIAGTPFNGTTDIIIDYFSRLITNP